MVGIEEMWYGRGQNMKSAWGSPYGGLGNGILTVAAADHVAGVTQNMAGLSLANFQQRVAFSTCRLI